MILFMLAACVVLAGVIHDYQFKADKRASAKAQAVWLAAFNERKAQEELLMQRQYDAIQRGVDARIAEMNRQQQEADSLAKRANLWKPLQPPGL